MIVRTSLSALAVGALVSGALALGAGAATAATTLVVSNNGSNACTGATYSTIQSAVDAATAGDTIKVCPGTYGESVTIDKPGLTIQGGQQGVDARGKRVKTQNTTVTNPNGAFVLGGSADDTTIDGFVLTGATGNRNGVADFQGASGLTLVNNVVQLNGNGVNMQNPDGTKPATISQNSFVNNNAGGVGNAQSGTGVFISNGPANNTTISDNNFSKHAETAINFAGDGSDPSEGLVVSGNKSTDDSTFVVAINSTGAVIDRNTITTSANAPGGHGTGILDFGSNTSLRIANNAMKATGPTGSSGVSVSNLSGSNSNFTNVVNNSISGWNNDIRIVSGNRNAYVASNKLANAQNDGIQVQSDVSGVTFSGNQVTGAATLSCEDPTTGNRTLGTANVWVGNTASTPSSPVGICRTR